MWNDVAEQVAFQLSRIADATTEMHPVSETTDTQRAIASEGFIDSCDLDARCKAALRRESISDVREITRERFQYTHNCGKVTLDKLIAYRDRTIGDDK